MRSSISLSLQEAKTTTSDSSNHVAEFLARQGIENSAIDPVGSDCSLRKYYRVQSASAQPLLVMDSSLEPDAVAPFIKIASIMTAMGLRAPFIFDAEPETGLLLIEDFGSQSLKQAILENPEHTDTFYSKMVDILLHIAKHRNQPSLLPYSDDLLYRELSVFKDWCIPQEHEKIGDELFALFQPHFDFLSTQPQLLTLRDYHVENLLALPDASIGIIDFQDAVLGHPAYDLVSLLQDARIYVSEELENHFIEYFLERSSFHKEDFLKAYYILGLQRGLKVIGIFNRKHLRDGAELYLQYLPRVMEYCHRCLNSGFLPELKNYFATNDFLLNNHGSN